MDKQINELTNKSTNRKLKKNPKETESNGQEDNWKRRQLD